MLIKPSEPKGKLDTVRIETVVSSPDDLRCHRRACNIWISCRPTPVPSTLDCSILDINSAPVTPGTRAAVNGAAGPVAGSAGHRRWGSHRVLAEQHPQGLRPAADRRR